MADARESEAAVLQRIAALVWPNEPRILVRAATPQGDGGLTSRVMVMRTGQDPRSPSGVTARPFYDP